MTTCRGWQRIEKGSSGGAVFCEATGESALIRVVTDRESSTVSPGAVPARAPRTLIETTVHQRRDVRATHLSLTGWRGVTVWRLAVALDSLPQVMLFRLTEHRWLDALI